MSEFQVLKLFPDGEGETENEKKNNKRSLWKLSETESKHKVIQESLLPSPESWLYYQAYGLPASLTLVDRATYNYTAE